MHRYCGEAGSDFFNPAPRVENLTGSWDPVQGAFSARQKKFVVDRNRF